VDNAVEKPVEERLQAVEDGVERRDLTVEEARAPAAYSPLTRENEFPPDVERRKLGHG
jgi:hypothetical protein